LADFIVKRLMLLIPVLVLISVISFLIVYITPGDPAVNAMMSPAGIADEQSVSEYRVKMGLDQPVIVQYVKWLERVLNFDLGYSYMTNQPVSGAIFRCFQNTAKLALLSMAVSLAIAIPIGIISAIWHGTAVDGLSRLFALIGVSMPNFWQAYLFIILFSLTLRLLPTSGYGNGGDLYHMALPALTLGTGYAAVTMRLMRSSMIEVLNQEYIKAAKAKGLKMSAIIARHALKNSLLPVITVAGLNFGYLLNGSVIVETIFGWPGLGNLFVNSVLMKDYPMVQGCILCVALVYVTVNLIVDISYMFVNPRIRYGSAN
jgi:peptide/nickel transport system permease protein